MKNLKILFYSLLFLFGCSPIKKEPIVDYNFNADKHYRQINFDSHQKRQTIVLIDKKESTLDTLNNFLKRNEIRNLHILKDSTEIKNLNYSAEKVKVVIIASKL